MKPDNSQKTLLITLKNVDIQANWSTGDYEEGLQILMNEGPWGILYIDYSLEDGFIPARTGLSILQHLEDFPEMIPPKIEIISSDPYHTNMMKEQVDKLMEIKKEAGA